MDSLQFLLQLTFTNPVPPEELDVLVQKFQAVIDAALDNEEISVTGAEIEDYDIQFERYD